MSENKRFLEGCEKLSDGRYRIHEKMNAIPLKQEIKEEKIIIEGKEVNTKKHYTFMVWAKDLKPRDFSGRNGNGRDYSDVIDYVVKENRPTISLTNHPENEVDMGKVNGVAKNVRMIDNWMCVDWYPADCEDGRRFSSVFDLGGNLCVSSSVLGELDDEGYVILNENFEVERLMDIVDSPSNGIYHYSNKIEKHSDEGCGFTEISNEGLNENLTILDKQNITESAENTQNDKAVEKESDDSIGEEKMPENTMNELAEQSMILNIKSMIRDAEKVTDLFEKKNCLLSADSFAIKLTEKTLHEEISKKIEDAENEIKELSTKGMQTDDLTDKCKALEDEVAKTNGELETIKAEKAEIEEKLKTVTTMYEEAQYNASKAELDKNAELTEKNHNLSKELCSLKAKNRNLESLMRKNQRVLESKVKRAEAELNTAIDTETFLKCKDKCKTLEDENADLCKKIEDLETTIETLKRANEAEVVDANVEEVLSLKKKLNEQIIKNNRLRKMLNESRLANLEKKESRFSKLRKNLEDEETDVIVDDEIIEDDNIDDENVIVTDNGIEVEGRDEDAVMEKLLKGDRS